MQSPCLSAQLFYFCVAFWGGERGGEGKGGSNYVANICDKQRNKAVCE